MKYITIRKDVQPGTGVRMANVRIPDRGKSGKTPSMSRWASFEGSLHGWRKNQPDGPRHNSLMKSVRAEGVNSTKSKLNQLANVTTDMETKIKARRDLGWLMRKYPAKSKR